jgi:hypothetical protein
MGGLLHSTNRFPRSGAVRASGRAFVDDGGPVNVVEATLFWALWGERHDASRLDANLTHLRAHGIHAVRILSMVGAEGWEDRRIDPGASDYWTVAERLLDRLARHGMRARVTVFADAQVMMPRQADRMSHAEAWAHLYARRPQDIWAFEVANEPWQNGFDENEAALRPLGSTLQRAGALVALGSPRLDQVCALYRGWSGIASLHYDRDISGPDGVWRPWAQPWGYPDEYRARERYDGPLPEAVINGEPIGPGSSGVDDRDPLRNAIGLAASFVAGNGAYCFHAGCGVRGGGAEDRKRGREADYMDLDPALLRGVRTVADLLPSGLARWQRHDTSGAGNPLIGLTQAVANRSVVRVWVATHEDRLVGVALGLRGTVTATAARPMTLNVVHPLTADTVETLRAGRGEALRIAPAAPALLLVGTLR